MTMDKSILFKFRISRSDKYIHLLHTAADKGIVMHISGEVEDFDSLVSQYSTEGLIENQVILKNPYEHECSSLLSDCYLYGVLRFNDEAKAKYFTKDKNNNNEKTYFKSVLNLIKSDFSNQLTMVNIHDGDSLLNIPYPPGDNEIYHFRFYTQPNDPK